MHAVRSTQGTLKHTVDNRMVSGEAIQGVADALALSIQDAEDVAQRKLEPAAAHDQIKKAVDKAQEDWDQYFLAEMIPQEQKLADQTTPLLDKAYIAIRKLQTRLQSGDIADLESWRNAELRPSLAGAIANLKALIDMQLTAANMDLEKAARDYKMTVRNSIAMLSAGGLLASRPCMADDPRRDASPRRGPGRGGPNRECASPRATWNSRCRPAERRIKPAGRAAPDEGKSAAFQAGP